MTIWRASRSDWRRRLTKLAALLWRRLLFRTQFVAITGSFGKTTTKELLAAILSSYAPTHATFDSHNAGIHVAQTILRARPWHRFVVLEVATETPGWIRRSTRIARPDIAVILNVGRTHTRAFATLDDTAREKAELLGTLGRRGVAILNCDDSRVAAMGNGRKFRVLLVGTGGQANVKAEQISSRWPERLSLTVAAYGQSQRIETKLVGTHWTTPVLAATAAALQCGVPLARIAEALKRVEPTPGRLDPRRLPSGAVILRDDFNGSIETFESAMRVMREATARRKLLVITNVTDSTESWNIRLQKIASEAASICNVIIFVGASDATRRGRSAALRAGLPHDAVFCFRTIRSAAEFLRIFLRSGDLALVRGRGVDHVSRIYHALAGDVSCWLERCPIMNLCDSCPKLFEVSPGPLIGIKRLETFSALPLN